MKNLTVVGTGYVGLSLSILLSQKHHVIAYDIDEEKINKINNRISPIKDEYIENYLNEKKLNLIGSLNKKQAYSNADYIIISTPTNYNQKNNSFDTSSVDQVISDIIKFNKNANIVIKSTVPFGYTKKVKEKYNLNKIFFSPEFLRESQALYDNLYPSRIIIGPDCSAAKEFANILLECSHLNKDEVSMIYMDSSEAEAVKLFSNTYLAMRISFFNELDSFCYLQKLNPKKVIEGTSADPRIGNQYNNPSFGYGGYCLPKDTQQLLSNFENIPNDIIKAIVDSNKTRKSFISDIIMKSNPGCVGIYRLVMKIDSDNFRESAVLDIIKELKKHNVDIILYEPYLDKNKNFLEENNNFKDIKLINNFQDFIQKSNIILANRLSNELEQYKDKVFSRDIFNKD